MQNITQHTRSKTKRSARRGGSSGHGIPLRAVLLLIVFAAGFAVVDLDRPRIALAAPCDPPVTNPIVCENSKTGNPSSEWDVSGAGDPSIQGFATDISVNKGQTVQFKVRSTASSNRIDIYRLGYYNGNGARKVAQLSNFGVQNQPACLTDSTGLVDCGNWSVTSSWAVPADAVSGIYIARPIRLDNQGASHIPFVVRDDSGNSPMLFQTADTTWQAYNNYGGKSLYDFNSTNGRAFKVSYNRPFNTRATLGGPRESYLFNSEYPMVRWLEANGYNVSYTTGVDSDRRGAELLEHQIFLSVGHDEYWSGAQRANVEAARNAGVDLAFFSGNEVFWKTRWENSIDASGTSHRTLVCYKETLVGDKIDPSSQWTGTWRDPRFSPPSDGGKPENGLTGTIFMVNGPDRNDPIHVPEADGKMRFWRNTSIATLGAGQIATLPDGVLGYEWDEDLDNGSRPAGTIRLSSTTLVVGTYLLDYGSSYGGGTATHNLTLYKHSSGALVFGAGTVQWSWGLDGTHDRGPSTPDTRMRQATVNLFADMGVQPGSLQAGLVAASASTDTAAPTSTITSPANGASLSGGVVNITGTATDTGGGRVGGVEVSTDNGATWRRADGRTNWTYQWGPTTTGSFTLRSRAVDDSGNIGSASAGVTVTVTTATMTFDEAGMANRELEGQYPTGQADWGTDTWYVSAPWGSLTTNSVSFAQGGVTSAQFSFVTGKRLLSIQAYNGGSATSTVTLNCGANPQKTENVPVGQQVTIFTGWTANCLTVTLGASNGWDTNFDNFVYDVNGGSDTTAPVISNVQATAVTGSTATITWTTNEASDTQVEYGTTTSYGSSTPLNSAQVTSHSVQLTGLTVAQTYHYRVKSRDLAGNLATSQDFTFTTSCPCTIWLATATPAVASQSDAQAIEVGVRFRSDVSGYINGIRFYKGPANTGTHTGNLWSNTGTLLATATFTNETATGWQQVNFSVPVAVTANTVYVASFHTTSGGYSVTNGYFSTTGVDTSPLGAPSSGSVGGNGLYLYGAGGFPTNTYNGTNYWVDVVFHTVFSDSVPPTVTGRTPAPSATNVATNTAVTATFSEPMTASTINGTNFTLRLPNNNTVPATVTYNAGTRTATLQPNAALAEGTVYTATVSGVKDAAGNTLAGSVTWSFTTINCPCTIWPSSATPAIASQSDTQAIELGVKFRSDMAGYITGIRFYKGSANTGTHVGSLWTSTGTLLATATFANETATGWQQVLFGAPVPITANTTYVASYHAPNGGYSLNVGQFSGAGVDNGILHALASGVDGGNGLFRYGTSAFPTNTYNGSNYWVDVVYSATNTDAVPPTVTGRTPAPSATNVATNTAVTATFSEPMTASTINGTNFTLRLPNNNTVPATVTYNAGTRTATLQPNAALAGGTTYTATVSGVTDAAGNALASAVTWSFTTINCPCTIWPSSATPAVASQSDTQAVELGVRFRSDISGFITGIRFYKGAANTGTHTGSLWSNTGTLLATATFTNETGSGWQQVNFSSPVAITANTVYVASYHAPNGGYSLNGNYFTNSGVDNGILHALRDGESGSNGVFRYGASGFPTSTYNGGNYWVDVVFSPSVSAAPAGGSSQLIDASLVMNEATLPARRRPFGMA